MFDTPVISLGALMRDAHALDRSAWIYADLSRGVTPFTPAILLDEDEAPDEYGHPPVKVAGREDLSFEEFLCVDDLIDILQALGASGGGLGLEQRVGLVGRYFGPEDRLDLAG